MKTYVITLSQVFPVNHPKVGKSTRFAAKVLDTLNDQPSADRIDIDYKRHTIRANYPLWAKRFEQIERGEACLSIRQWTGKPYRSKQTEIARLTKDDGIGLQKLVFPHDRDGMHSLSLFHIENARDTTSVTLASNDGLSTPDWRDWFRTYDLSQPLAIIHFTKYRY